MTIQEQAAQVIWDEQASGIVKPRDLADAGLLAPDLSAITRLTIAGGGKRHLEEWGIHGVELHIQDEGQTLKVFYKENQQ